MYSIKKRNGEAEVFELGKIKSAIARTFESCNRNYQDSIVEIIALKAVSAAETKVADGLLSVEDIQDAVEKTLMTLGYEDVAKAYILYRKQHEKARNAQNTLLNYKNVVESYTKKLDWRVKENATVTYSVGGLILGNSGAVTANYWLSEIYDEEIANAHRNCDLHIHDLSMLSPYCGGWSLKQLIKEGLGGIEGKITSTPASHLSTLCNQMVNFLGCTQNEYAGAQAFSSVDTYLAPFVKVDNLTYKEVKQCIQSLVFGLNTPSRWGTQAPFTNFTMDWTVPDDLAELNCIVGGEEIDLRYKDCKREMDMINKAIIDVMLEGDANGRGFQYPVLTYSITKDFDWDEESINNQLLFEMTAKYGIPYFSNYINSDMSPSDLRAMCPVTPDTLVVVRSKQNGIRVCQIKDVYNGYNIKGTLYDVWTGKDWCAGRPVKVDKTDVYEIVFSNGYSVRMGENHLQPTRDNGTLKASELKEGMWLPFNKHSYGTDLGSYEFGYAVGAYAGDGSHDSSAIVYSLCKFEKDDETEKTLTKFWKSVGFDVKTTYSDNNVRFVRVNGNPYDIVSRYVFGENALDKGLTNKTFGASDEFKRGFIAGLRATDGSREKRRISTSSKTMTEHLNILFSSLGLKCTIGSADTRDGRYSVNPNYTVAFPERERYGDIFDEDDRYIYYKIKTITKCNYSGDYLYCFEVDNDDHLFALANGLITHNCRLRLDLRELRKKSGGYFGSGDSTGSIGVVTINMPRLAYTSKDEAEFYTRLDKLMDIAARSLEIKRSVISQFLDNGLYPYTKRYLGSFNNYFSTIGLVGMNEACLNAAWIKDTIASEAGYRFSCAVLDHMRERLADYQEKYGNLYNLEATPAESTSHRFAKHDVEAYPDIITAGTKTGGTPYYTNSSHLPVDFTEDIFTALDIQDGLQTKYTSGTVFHAFLGEKLPSWQSAMKLTRTIAENYRLPYFTFSPTYSVCKNHGYIAGEHFTCPECGEATEVYSRVTGYYRAVQNFNDGKAQEYKDRTEYVINSIPEKFNTEDTHDESPYPTSSVKKITLFATTTCPNCAQAKKQLTAAGIDYDVVIADGTDPVGTQLAIDCGVKQAPTLVLPTGEFISNVSNIIRYIRENK